MARGDMFCPKHGPHNSWSFSNKYNDGLDPYCDKRDNGVLCSQEMRYPPKHPNPVEDTETTMTVEDLRKMICEIPGHTPVLLHVQDSQNRPTPISLNAWKPPEYENDPLVLISRPD